MTAEQKLDKIIDELARVRAWQDAHTRDHVAIARDIEENRNELFGLDGGAGLKTRVHTLELNSITIAARAAAAAPRPWWASVLSGAMEKVLAGAVLGLLAWLLLAYRHIPGT